MTDFKDDDFQNTLQAARRKSLEITEFLDLASTAYDDLKDRNRRLLNEASALRDNRDFLEKDRREILAENERLRNAKEEVNDLRDQNRRLMDEVSALRHECARLEKDRDFLEQDRRVLQTVNKKLRDAGTATLMRSANLQDDNERLKAVKCPAFLPTNPEDERIVDELVRAHAPSKTTRRNLRPSVDEVRAPRVSRAASEALALQLNRDSLEKERRQLQIEIELLRHANSVSRTSNLSLTIDLTRLRQDNERLRQTNARLAEHYNARPPADELAEREIERLQRHLKRVRKSASAMAKELAEIRKQPKPCKCAYHRFPDGNSFQVVCPEHASIRDWEVTLRRDIDPHRLKPAPLEKAPAPAPEGFRVGKGCDCLCGCWLSEEGSKHECGVLATDLCAPCCDENDI